jgi:hypothetical protein
MVVRTFIFLFFIFVEISIQENGMKEFELVISISRPDSHSIEHLLETPLEHS